MNDLKELLHKKLDFFKQLCKLTAFQIDEISMGNIEEFNKHIINKQKVIDQIDLLNINIAKAEAGLDSENLQVEDLDHIHKEIFSQIELAVELDKKLREAFEKQLRNLNDSVESMRTVRKTVDSYYSKKQQIQGYFVDKKK